MEYLESPLLDHEYCNDSIADQQALSLSQIILISFLFSYSLLFVQVSLSKPPMNCIQLLIELLSFYYSWPSDWRHSFAVIIYTLSINFTLVLNLVQFLSI